MYVSVDGYAAIVRKILHATKAPAAFVTEGGYDLDALDACIRATIAQIEAHSAFQGPTPQRPRG